MVGEAAKVGWVIVASVELAVAVTIASTLVGALLVGIRFWPKPTCPGCRTRSIERVDVGVFNDPEPERDLCRCNNCGDEWVRIGRNWMLRSDWRDADDEDEWGDLNRT